MSGSSNGSRRWANASKLPAYGGARNGPMRVLPQKGFLGIEGQRELIGTGAIFGAGANATNSFKNAIYLTENWIGPSDSVVRQRRRS